MEAVGETPKVVSVVIAILDTRHYSFSAVGRTQEDAERAMRGAWDKHRAQTGAALSFDDLADDVNYCTLPIGGAARDGRLIFQPEDGLDMPDGDSTTKAGPQPQ